MEIVGRVDIDPNELNALGGNLCPIYFHSFGVPPDDKLGNDRSVPILSTWDGSDFVLTRNWRTAKSYCTRRFVDLASKNRWTNFRFDSPDSMPGVGI